MKLYMSDTIEAATMFSVLSLSIFRALRFSLEFAASWNKWASQLQLQLLDHGNNHEDKKTLQLNTKRLDYYTHNLEFNFKPEISFRAFWQLPGVIPGVYGQLYLLRSSVLGPGQLSGDNISEEEGASQACWRQVMMMMMMMMIMKMMMMIARARMWN